MDPKAPKGIQKGTKKESKGRQRETKGAKGSQGAFTNTTCGTSAKRNDKTGPRAPNFRPIKVKNSIKQHPNNY